MCPGRERNLGLLGRLPAAEAPMQSDLRLELVAGYLDITGVAALGVLRTNLVLVSVEVPAEMGEPFIVGCFAPGLVPERLLEPGSSP